VTLIELGGKNMMIKIDTNQTWRTANITTLIAFYKSLHDIYE